MKPTTWTVFRDPGALKVPDEVLGTVDASSRAEALTLAEQLHGPGVVVADPRMWPTQSGKPGEPEARAATRQFTDRLPGGSRLVRQPNRFRSPRRQ